MAIGNQIWMAANLKVTHEPDGTEIPTVVDGNANGTNDEWGILGDNDTDKAFCYYNNNANGEKDTYGALYTYAAAKDACPTGWHLPSSAEWTELNTYLTNNGHSGNEGTALKSTTGWNSDGNGIDAFGFNALPGGIRYENSSGFNSEGSFTNWWLSTVSDSDNSNAFFYGMGYNMSYIFSLQMEKSAGKYVRCVKD